ncbi:MAG: hypothetical protein P4L69_16890 [Desulfosporosinus sp.]|nr:hypothetical protein [Desulfosporosinus sp.]
MKTSTFLFNLICLLVLIIGCLNPNKNPFLISKAVLDTHNDKYLLTILQTEYQKPLQPDEQGFSTFESMYRGSFDLLIQNSSGRVTSQVSLNKYFGNDELGCNGSFPLVFKDYNRDGNYDLFSMRLV